MFSFENHPLFLAPLAGFSDLPLRSVVKRFGCDATVSEMISANALVFCPEKSLKMIKKSENETPYFVQIAGSDPKIIKQAVEILNEIDGIDGIDLNCGCPVPKVVRQNAGSALLQNLDLLSKLIEIIKKTSNKKYTSAKVRLGFDTKNPVNIALAVQNAGADFIAMHARTRAGGYSAKPDYEAIAAAKSAIKIPLIANGNINSQNANQILSLTKADALMIGRATIGNPWVFYEIKNQKTVAVDEKIKKEIILAHFDEMIKFYGDHGAVIFRKHLHEYSKGYADATNFRCEINTITNAEKMREKIKQFF